MILFTITIFSTGCESAKRILGKLTGKTAPIAASPSGAAKVAMKCANGSDPEVISGNCQGAWKFIKNGSKSECEFAWGPKITCPSGSKSMNVEASCYGSTMKSVSTNDEVHSEKDCLEKFGQTPMPIKYEMFCCN